MSRGRFTSWPILSQVLAGPLLLLVVLVVLVATTGLVSRRLQESAARVNQSLAVMKEGSELTILVMTMESGVRGFVITRDETFLAPYEDARAQTDVKLASLRGLVADQPAQLARLDRVAALIRDWHAVAGDAAVRITRAGGDAGPLVRSGAGRQRTEAIRAEMEDFQATEQQRLDARSRDDEAARQVARLTFFGAVVLAVLGFGLAYLAALNIVRPVQALAGAARRISQGDLSIRLPVTGGNELAQTRAAFNTMAESLAAARARGASRAVLNAAREPMVLLAPDGTIVSVNRSFYEVFFGGRTIAIVGRRLEQIEARLARFFTDADAFRAFLADTVTDTERPATCAVVQHWPQARELDVFSTPVRNGAGRHLGRLYVFRDVTREREVDRMKTEFVSLVSHELRTPLTSIKGYVDLLLEGEVGPLGAEQQEFLEIVRTNADRLVALINDLLDISRIESGRVELKRTAVDLGRLARDAAEALRPQVERKEQTLTLDLPADLPAVLADRDRLTQILNNLLSNAHKYTPKGGAITVAARAGGDQVAVEVRDTGIELSEDEQAKLFTKFYRAENRTTDEVGGTGLGLAITRSLVELHGGTIGVRSAPGEGSTFHFTLPVATAAEEPPRVRETFDAASGGPRVLVVDDEPDIANLVRRYLERAGYRVATATNAADALAAAQLEQPDLITLDVNLADADGFTVLERLKANPATAAIPVVMISVLPDTGKGKLLGAVDYLTKPVREQALLERVARHIGEGGRLVLVADDDRDGRRLIAGFLRRAGYRVLEAADGRAALALARRERPDLALLDIRMPELDGVSALRALRADPALRELPVLMMTASPALLEASRPAVAALGAALLPRKPCTAEELAAAIARELAREGKG